MKGKLIWSILWALVVVFIIVVSMIFIPPVSRLLMRNVVLLPAIVVFFGLGVTLLVLTVKTKVAGRLKKFLLLTGASVVGLPVFVLLHNAVSALFNTEEPVFFILAIIVCPIGFLVGAVGSIVLAIKSKQPKHSGQNI